MEATGDGPASDQYSSSKRTRFRFKSRRPRAEEGDDDLHSSREKRRRHSEKDDHRSHRHRRHHHCSRRRREQQSGPKDDPSLYDDTYLPNSRSEQYMDPDQAFRESLFDALADDEGAAYWEGVYGQPIHTYPNTKTGPEGELERMSDEEYAAYVRARMYEKSHEHIIEERQCREQERQRRNAWRDRTRHMEAERDEFQKRVQESLQRGEARKAAKQWKEAWASYNRRWDELKNTADHNSNAEVPIRDAIPWPVLSGKRRDVSKEEIENFLCNAPASENDSGTLLKAERVKWHPDKIQQRFGERGIDAETMKSVTTVFQVLDRMWNDQRDRKPKPAP